MTLVGPHAELAPQTEAGCRMVINTMLLHTALTLDSTEYGVAIVPEFHIDDTRLEPTGYTYGGVVDYMIIYTDRSTRGVSRTGLRSSTLKYFPGLIAQSPKLAFLSEAIRKLLSCSIYEAKSDAVMTALPQAAMAAAVKAKKLGYVRFVLSNIVIHPHHRVDTFRGCVATSREWLFFVYNRSGVGGTLSFMQPLELEKDFSNLPLILGLLRDWVRLIGVIDRRSILISS